jgi:membrane protease YdiL (CAAX protease family)
VTGLGLWDHVLAFTLAVLFPIRASVFGVRRLRLAPPADVPRVRLWLYRQAIALQWGLVAAVAVLWATHARSPLALGLVPQLNGGTLGVLAGLIVAIVAVWRQRVRAIADDEALGEVRRKLAHLERFMPHALGELRWFAALSWTAGICEEILYRGYLFWYVAHVVGPLPAAAIASAFFGLGHLYQGWRGVLLTSALGGFFAMVYAVTGSLFAGMLIHGLMDLHSGHLAYVAYTREPPASAEAEALEPDGPAPIGEGGALPPEETPA